jgi:glycosyltransferase involved in cell wall biosynthesis
MTRRPDVWIVVPAYNEGTMIGEVVRSLPARHRVVVIDDGSPDDTAAKARAAGATVLRHAINLGQGAALQTGISYALAQGASRIVTFDGDGQHAVGDIDRLVGALDETGADVAVGNRFAGQTVGMPPARRLLLGAAWLFTRITVGTTLRDPHNGLRCLSAPAAARIRIRQNRMAHASELVEQFARLRLRVVEVPSTVTYTPYSLAKGQSTGNAVRIVAELLAGRLYR